MKKIRPINIYMGVIGEAYVDKEDAYAVLLAAKKNILDVEAIIDAATSVKKPLGKAIDNATLAIDKAEDVYTLLKDAIKKYEVGTSKYQKLVACLAELNENDFDNDFSNGGNIYTARENYEFAYAQNAEIDSILETAQELLEANRLNAVIRCKEYNIAKEIFESMIPDNGVSPENISDEIENELIRRINTVNDNLNYVNAVANEIITVSENVTNRINQIESGADEVAAPANDILYWYAGNINPKDLMDTFGFKYVNGTYVNQISEVNENGLTVITDVDFGIDGPLKANHWFKQPLHLIQDGQLIAGVDGGKAKYKYWYVAVPRHILTSDGLAAYNEYKLEAGESALTKTAWAEENAANTKFVKSLWPCMPNENMLHINGVHSHSENIYANIFDNKYTTDNIADNPYGYELLTYNDPDDPMDYTVNESIAPLSINNIIYDIWRVPVTAYNAQRLNVFMNLGEVPVLSDESKSLFYYIGTQKPNYNSKPSVIYTQTTADAYNATLPGAISTANWKDENGNPVTNPDDGSLIYEREHFTTTEVRAYNSELEGAVHSGDEVISEGWTKITEDVIDLTDDNAKDTGSQIFYVAIPVGYTIIDKDGNDLLEDETTSKYTMIYYQLIISGNKYNVYITANEDCKFDAIIKLETEPEGPTGETEPEGPTGETEPEGPTGETEPEGPTGETEPEGPTGETEPEGPTGETEPVGPTGETEPEGPTGETEPVGPTNVYTEETAAAYNAQLPGAVHAGDIQTPAVEGQPAVEAQNAIYSFESFNNEQKEVKYGEGTVEVIDLREDGATVRVLTNESTDPHATEFAGQEFNVASLDENATLQLFSTNGLAQPIWVTVTKVSDAVEGQPAIEAQDAILYTEETAKTYNATLEGAVQSGDSLKPAYTFTEQLLSGENLKALVDTNTGKPTEQESIDMTNQLSGPTLLMLVYPLDWEVQENGTIVKPVVKDPNGFEAGTDNEGDNTIECNGVTYRVLPIELGKMIYTIEF